MKYIRVVIGVVFLCFVFSGCQADIANLDIEKTIETIKAEAANEIKKTLKNEIEEIFSSDELASSLGISSQELEKMGNSIKNYIENYEYDGDSLKEVKATVESLLGNAQGMSVNDLQNQINQIIGE